MKKIMSERNLAVFLFIAAFTIFSFAQEDAKKNEKLHQDNTAARFFTRSAMTAERTMPSGGTAVKVAH